MALPSVTPRTSLLRLETLLLLAFGLAFGTRGAGAADEPAPAAPAAEPAAAAAKPAGALLDDASPEAILDAFEARWKALKDCAFTMDTTVRRGTKEDRSTLRFGFRHPALFYSHVLGGRDEGTWVWRGADGRIRARKDGVLSLIKITMEPDDPRLADVRGARLQDADWGAMVRGFRRRAKAGWTFRRAPDAPIRGADCFVVEATGPADAMGETREAFHFEKANLNVRARGLWEGDRQVDDTLYYDAEIDRGLTADDFEK